MDPSRGGKFEICLQIDYFSSASKKLCLTLENWIRIHQCRLDDMRRLIMIDDDSKLPLLIEQGVFLNDDYHSIRSSMERSVKFIENFRCSLLGDRMI